MQSWRILYIYVLRVEVVTINYLQPSIFIAGLEGAEIFLESVNMLWHSRYYWVKQPTDYETRLSLVMYRKSKKVYRGVIQKL